uniref:Ig-like domain-containing protein n=1 Tax=Chrysemys picta bellii TaxID=8478 RepID=A0A8C3II41_CHRPI
MNGIGTIALVDSGSAVTLFSGKLVGQNQLTRAKNTGVTCIHGTVNFYPTIPVRIEIQGNTTRVTSGVVPRLPYPVLISRDFPGFESLLSPVEPEESSNPRAETEAPTDSLTPIFAEFAPELFSSPGKPCKSRRERKADKKLGTRILAENQKASLVGRRIRSGGQETIQASEDLETIYGCYLWDDNVIQVFYQDSYDGRDFLIFDKEPMTWVAADIGAQITKRRWDVEVHDNQGWKQYLEETCRELLSQEIEYGKETLQRKVRPAARVSDRSSHDGLTTLFCKVSGFYPKDITVTWLKNGESRQQDTYSEGILPNGDRTYQTWVTMEIDPKIKAHYSCHVEHESLLEPLSISWGKEFVFITAVVLIGVIIGVVIWKKKRQVKNLGWGGSLDLLGPAHTPKDNSSTGTSVSTV